MFNLAGRSNGCCNMWAPEFHLIDGPNGPRWYLYCVAGRNVADFNPTQRLHVLESAGTDPMGPYTFKADLGSDWQLDASVLRVNNNLYLLGTYNAGSNHGNDSASGGCDMNRSTRAQKFTWNADGTPDFGAPVRLGVTLPAPSGE
ncbi:MULTISPECIES: hypothetical protein [unclassified Solwaraspora]|uniref:hypothetical protein n=1 Tax=unclassified Solwaraspora TaxID=2627926 RepID=UPI00248B5B87|nr:MULTISPECIES: hypothetical protein [unclassified Solwaraspora]WBB98773.1 hypothetical protein O7553_07760 [Solwaraspora sp. WMMA2059]WBC22674.1 hypothetical protein O7543_09605 [Solwaraspora sp. WMMA2080]WJK35277.1 hypothetical protein O7610_02510 [Solwaraspora sp. WMMA2065]